MTDTLELKGHIDADGKLQVELPPGLRSLDVRVRIEIESAAANDNPADEANGESAEPETWTEEELRDALTFRYRNPHEVIADVQFGGLEDASIDDPVEWVNDLRQDEENRRRRTW